jgi:tripartite-type tricarboxylate transporter receptor subunit TctC
MQPRVVELLNAEINRALNLPDIREKLEATGLTVLNESPQAFARTLREDFDTYGKVIRAIGLIPQ